MVNLLALIQTSISLPKELHKKAIATAKKNYVSFSHLVRRGLELAIKELEEKK